MLTHGRNCCGYPLLALVEPHLGPLVMLAHGTVDRGHGLVVIHTGRSLNLGTVHRVHVNTGVADPHPVTVDEVADAVGVESFGSNTDALGIGLGPRRSGLED